MPVYAYQNGWKPCGIRVRQEGTFQDVVQGKVRVDGIWRTIDIFPVPAGLIVPFKGSTIPDGWLDFNPTSNRYIVGAGGSTYVVGNYGDGTPIQNLTTTSAGAHTGSTAITHKGTHLLTNRGTSSAGSHLHTISLNYSPPYIGMKFIKASQNGIFLPSDAVVLSWDTDFSNLTQQNWNSFLYIADSFGSGGSNTVSGVTSSNGSHKHGTNWSDFGYGSQSGYLRRTILTGDHTHSFTVSITESIKKAMLKAWSAVSQFIPKRGMIAFWGESTTPPAGWVECNGENNTPDLRGYFIYITSSTTGKTGNNSVIIPAFSVNSNSWSHNHIERRSDTQNNITGDTYHGDYSATHSHSVSGGTYSYVPPWLALRIIMKA